MLKAIVIAFTLKGQDEKKIVKRIEEVAQRQPHSILIHGFLPRKRVVEQKWSTGIVDALDKHFPNQLNMFGFGKNWREDMAQAAKALNANILVIGEEKEGVAEEVKLYKELGLSVYYYKLDEKAE